MCIYYKFGLKPANLSTGYSLSDQHIFSLINPTYDDWISEQFV